MKITQQSKRLITEQQKSIENQSFMNKNQQNDSNLFRSKQTD